MQGTGMLFCISLSFVVIYENGGTNVHRTTDINIIENLVFEGEDVIENHRRANNSFMALHFSSSRFQNSDQFLHAKNRSAFFCSPNNSSVHIVALFVCIPASFVSYDKFL